MHKIDQVRNDSWYAAEAKNAAIALHMAGDYEQARVHYKILLDLKLKQLLAIEAISVASVDRLAHTAGFDAESKKLTNLKKAIGTSLSTQDNSGLRIRRTWKNKGGTLEDQDIQHGDVEFEFVQSALPDGYMVNIELLAQKVLVEARSHRTQVVFGASFVATSDGIEVTVVEPPDHIEVIQV